MVEKVNGAIGIKIKCNSLKNILEHLQAKGKTQIGENVPLMDDCIIRVDDKGIWSITIDNNKGILAHIKVDNNKDEKHGLETYGKGKIPLDIKKTLNYLMRFSEEDSVELIYENGMIVLRNTNEKLEYPILTESFFAGIREEAIRNDMLKNIFRKFKENREEIHKQMLAFIKKHRSVYTLNEDKSVASIHNGTKLENYIDVSCKKLKDVVRDGDLLENRIYPFKVSENKLNITIKSLRQGELDRISRDIYIRKGNLNGEFTTDYPSQFNAAVSSTRGHIHLYFGENKPLLLVKTNDFDYGLNMSYIVSQRPNRK